jgi:hypothetical protein
MGRAGTSVHRDSIRLEEQLEPMLAVQPLDEALEALREANSRPADNEQEGVDIHRLRIGSKRETRS